MSPAITPLRIVGQGLAGSLLAWRCEREGIDFQIIDHGHEHAASRVAAGIINPITGQRIVKSWRIDQLLPGALALYREIEVVLNLRLLFPMRVRRRFRDDGDRKIAYNKHERGELAPYLVSLDKEGFWIESAYRVDTRQLIESLRQRWIKRGRLMVGDAEFIDRECPDPNLITIWCVGAGELRSDRFAFANLQAAKGEVLGLNGPDLDPAVILNDGHWVLPVKKGQARVGATYSRSFENAEPTAEARAELSASARRLIGGDFQITDQEAGLRMTTEDKHPVIGRHPKDHRTGIFNGLGSKGGLLAPWLAEQWIAHLLHQTPIDQAVDVRRFFSA